MIYIVPYLFVFFSLMIISFYSRTNGGLHHPSGSSILLRKVPKDRFDINLPMKTKIGDYDDHFWSRNQYTDDRNKSWSLIKLLMTSRTLGEADHLQLIMFWLRFYRCIICLFSNTPVSGRPVSAHVHPAVAGSSNRRRRRRPPAANIRRLGCSGQEWLFLRRPITAVAPGPTGTHALRWGHHPPAVGRHGGKVPRRRKHRVSDIYQ